MKRLSKLLAMAALVGPGLALAALPADISASPGVLFVHWHHDVTMDNGTDGATMQKLEVRDESGSVLASVPATPTGTQYVRIPSHTQGRLTVSMGNSSTDYRIPYGMGEGRNNR